MNPFANASPDSMFSNNSTRVLIHAGRAQLERYREHIDGFAQELKNSLQVLLITVEREERSDTLPQAVRRWIDRMNSEIEYQRMCADSGKLVVPPVIDGMQTARTLLSFFEKLYSRKCLDIEARPERPVPVYVDERDLKVILWQLIDNACKWAEQQIRVAIRAQDLWLEISVEDDGPGVESEIIPHILTRGGRADSGTTGYGLGLAVVQRLVTDTYNGKLEIGRSALGGLRVLARLDCTFHDQRHGRDVALPDDGAVATSHRLPNVSPENPLSGPPDTNHE